MHRVQRRSTRFHPTHAAPLAVVLALVTLLGVAAGGCATKKHVRAETGAVHTRVDSVEKQVEQNQTAIRDTEEDPHFSVCSERYRYTLTTNEVTEVSRTAKEALERAESAGKLAEGKLLYETVLTDSDVRFAFDKAELSDEARAALDEFATELKSGYKDVYIEIQGHTDAVGSEDYNQELALPLHRMSVISYGESAPIADNESREGRAQNRRVVLVVLQ